MKNNLQAFNATLTSMEVAEMVEKTHDNLIKSIRRYSKYIDESNASLDAVKNDAVSEEDNLKQLKNEVVKAETIDLQEFWTESQYKDGKGQTRPCYNITKKGCEFIAHKCT